MYCDKERFLLFWLQKVSGIHSMHKLFFLKAFLISEMHQQDIWTLQSRLSHVHIGICMNTLCEVGSNSIKRAK